MNWLALVVCGGVFVYHFAVVWRYAVNVPFFDEWAVFNPDALPAGFSLRWLFAQHNEHRLVTTKLLVWAQFLLNGWDTSLHQVVNFVVFGVLLVWLYWFARRAAPGLAKWVVLFFLVFLLTPLNIENHFMAFQSQVHFWLLFFLVAAYFLFEESQSWRSLAAGCVAATLSVYSLAGGVLSSLVLLALFASSSCCALTTPGTSERGRESWCNSSRCCAWSAARRGCGSSDTRGRTTTRR